MAVDESTSPSYNTPIPSKIMTPDRVETRVGTFEFEDGLPSAETAARLFDTLDFLRGVEVFLQCVPAASIVVYDPQTRSELQTDQPFPSHNNARDDLTYNEDGSVDIHFGPQAPHEGESNWIQTVRGKGWFAILRLYGPLEPWFEKSWVPGDIERA
jgi:hypothetical protein